MPTHITLDNNDGKEETATGKGTAHHPNCTIFQPLLDNEIPLPREQTKPNISIELEFDERNEIPEYTLWEKKPPPMFEYFNFEEKGDVLEFCFMRDVIWACAAAFTTPDSEDRGQIPIKRYQLRSTKSLF